MTLPGLENVAQLAVGRVVNSLPESLLIVLSASLLLRLIGRRNSGTRFAVWMVAFVAVAALPLVGLGKLESGVAFAGASVHPEIAIPSFWAEAVLFAWIPIALLALTRVLIGLFHVRRIRATCAEIDMADVDPILRQTMQQHSAGRPVCLATSTQVRVPTAIGFRRPAVVLPPWVLRDLSADQIRPILIHELAHLARRDDWTNLLQKAVRAIFCFHPALWWIDARLSRERELACDDAVLVATADPRAYASSLLGLLEMSGLRRGWSMAQAAIGRACEASQRITRILSIGRPASTRASRSALGLAATLSAASCGLLLAAPRLVVFEPARTLAQVHTENIPHLEPASPRVAAPAARVVSADWNPDSDLPAIPAVKRAVVPASENSHPRAHESHRPEHAPFVKPSVPQVQLASARTRQVSAPAPLLVVFETTRVTRTALPPIFAAVSSVSGTAPAAHTAPAPVTQIETVQFLEQRDASGVHIQILRLLLIAPAPSGGAEPGPISRSI